MARLPADLESDDLAFLTERHLATLTTLRSDGTPHVVAIVFTYDDEAGLARVIASDGSQKVVNAERSGRAVLCQVEGRRWLSLEGSAVVRRDPESVSRAERLYEVRYRPPRENPQRVAIEITVDRILGRG